MVNRVFRIPQSQPTCEAATSSSVRPVRPFVAGPENALLGLVAQSIWPPSRYNPILLYGPTGVGKSHLLELFAHQFLAARPDLKVHSLTASDLVRGISAAREVDALAELRSKHRKADLFILDDLQDLSGKSYSQHELLHTYDELAHRQQQVLIACRGSLADIDQFIPALRSRLTGGLAVPIAKPGAAARRAIIEEMTSKLGLSLTDEVVELLVCPRQRHVRKLDSAAQLCGVLCELELLTPQPILPATVRQLLEQPSRGLSLSVRQIASQTARHFQLKASDLTGDSRRQATVRARGVAIYLTRKLTGRSLAEIGRHFGHRDHSTILHSYRKTERFSESDPVIRKSIQDIANGLGASGFLS